MGNIETREGQPKLPGQPKAEESLSPQDRRTRLLEGIMQDKELVLALGPIFLHEVIPGLVDKKLIRPDQGTRIRQTAQETLFAGVSPVERERYRREASEVPKHRDGTPKVNDFI